RRAERTCGRRAAGPRIDSLFVIGTPEIEPVARNAPVLVGRDRARSDGLVCNDLFERYAGDFRRTRKIGLGGGKLIAWVEASNCFRSRQFDRIVGAERQPQDFAPRRFRGIAFLESP